MATGVSEDPINLLLVGDSGGIITATANNIIGEKRFQWWKQQDKAYQAERARVQGHDVVVVGNPHVRNTDIGSCLDKLTTEMKLNDFDAMLIIVSFARRVTQDQEDKWGQTLQTLEDLPGTDYIKQRGILVVIPTETYRPDQTNGLTIEEFLQKETGVLQKLIKKCDNRLIVFDNKTGDQNQVKRLLDMVTEMKKEVGRYNLSNSPIVVGSSTESQDETLEERVKTLPIFVQDHENIPLEQLNVKQLTEIGANCQEYHEELTDKIAAKNDSTSLISKTSKVEDDISVSIDNVQQETEGGQIGENGKYGDGNTYGIGEDFITFLLVGKTGQGKSSIGNSILGEKKFKATANFTSTTKKCQREVVRVQDHNVVIVDSPGLADTDIETAKGLKQLADEMINIFATQPDGFDVILITIQYGQRLTEEDKRVFQELDLLLGESYVNHCGILVITHVDKHDPKENGPIEEFIEKQEGIFQQLRQDRVKNRVVYFNNDTKDESVRQAQLGQLLNMAVQVKKNPQISIPEVCRTAQKTCNEAVKKAGEPVIRSETTDKLTLIGRESVIMAPGSKDIEHLKIIIEKLQQLHANLENEVEDKKRADKLLCTVSNLEGAIRMKISAIEKKDDEADADEKIRKELTALGEQLANYADIKYTLLREDLEPALEKFIYPVFSISSYFKKIVKTPASFLSWLKKK